MKTISIKIKLILLVILPIIILTAVLTGLAIYQTYQLGRQEVETARGSMRASKETELKNYVDTAVSAIKPLYEKAAADDKAAQEQARVILRQLGYGKDGDVYKRQGYMSVRVKPGREEITSANALYQAIRSGQSRHGVHGGDVVRADWLGKLNGWSQLGVRARIWIAPVSYTHLDVYKRQGR